MLDYPLQVDIDVTNNCNFNCEYCTAKSRKDIHGEMTIEEMINLVDELYEMGVLSFNFAGGEPLLKKDINKLLMHTINLPCTDVTLVTNGTLLKEDFFKILDYDNFHLIVSLDNMAIAVNEKYRENTETVIENISKLIDKKKRFTIAQVVTSQNIKYYKANLRILHAMGIFNVLIIKYISQNREDINEVSYDKWTKFLCELTEMKKNGEIDNYMISVACPWEIYLPLLEKGYGADDIYKTWNYKSPLLSEVYSNLYETGCHAGKTSCNILSNGDVYPCSIAKADGRLLCGNIKEQKFSEIWRTSEVFRELRKMKLNDIQGNCKKCKIEKICGGGCRIRAININGEINAEDVCPHNGGRYAYS